MKRLKMFSVIAVSLILTLTPTAAYAGDYKVKSGDTLSKISKLFKVPTDTLKLDNFLSSSKLHTGQVLYVPAREYKVKSGDTLKGIAKKYSITETALKQANGKSNSKVKSGEKLLLPGVKPVSDGKGTVIPYTNKEVDLLARLIMAEAGGESYQAMVAVGGVVVNRVQSKDWPDSLTKVINHVSGGYHQFTPVKNGMINKPASDLAVRAAWASLYGSDPSKGAMFYFDKSSTNQFLRSKKQTAAIDSMIFVK